MEFCKLEEDDTKSNICQQIKRMKMEDYEFESEIVVKPEESEFRKV
jgi:hypothetical protein